MKAVLQHRLSSLQETAFRAALPDWLELAVDSEPARSARILRDAEVLLHVLTPVTPDVIGMAPALRLIQKIGVGLNTIDLEAARCAGIRVANMPGTNSQAVAEHTLMLILAVLRKVRILDAEARAGRGWDIQPPFFDEVGEVCGRVLGFVGFGEIPRRLAPVMSALGARVIYCMSKQESTSSAQKRTFNDLLMESDIVSLHLPLTGETRQIMDEAAFSRMKRGAIVINTARGDLIHQRSLCDALASRKIAGVGLDVATDEPYSADEPLLKFANAVLTPHVAWLTPETLLRSARVIGENCARLRAGEALLHEIAARSAPTPR